MADVFVSYDHEDKNRIEFLIEELQAHGLSVWWDREILAGDEYQKKIQDQINNSESVLVIWTERSIKSDWVRAEAMMAFDRRLLVSVRLANVEVPIPFNIQNVVSLIDWPHKSSRQEMNRLLRQLQENLDDARREAAPAPPAEENLSVRLARRVVEAAFGSRSYPMRQNTLRARMQHHVYLAYLDAMAAFNQMTEASLDEAWERVNSVNNGLVLQELRVDICRHRALLGNAGANQDYAALLQETPFTSGDLAHLTSLSRFDLPGIASTLGLQLQSPDDQSLLHYASWILLPLGERELALKFIELSISANPMNALARFRLALLAINAGDLMRSMTEIESCCLIAPRSPLFRTLQIALARAQGNEQVSTSALTALENWQHPLKTKALAPDIDPGALYDELDEMLNLMWNPGFSPEMDAQGYSADPQALRGSDWHNNIVGQARTFLESE